jgi:hypothetical protein
MRFLPVLLTVVPVLFADLLDQATAPLHLSLSPEQMAPLLKDSPRFESELSLEYADLYSYDNRRETLPDSTYGPVEEKAEAFQRNLKLYYRHKYVRLGVTVRSVDFSGLVHKGDPAQELYELDLSALDPMVHGAFSRGPFSLGGGSDEPLGRQHLFFQAKWRAFSGGYAFVKDHEQFNLNLQPATLTKELAFDPVQKANHFQAAFDLPEATLSVTYGPLSILNDSGYESDDRMGALVFFSGDQAGVSLESRDFPVRPYASYSDLGLTGFAQGFFNSIRYAALDNIRFRMRLLKAGAGLPFGFKAGGTYRKINVSGNAGYLEASPFNKWNFFTHTYYRIRAPQAWCIDKSVYAEKFFSFKSTRLEADFLAAYEMVDLESGFLYRQREYITLFGPLGWPTLGPEYPYTLADWSQDFLYFHTSLSYPFRNLRLTLEGSQYVPLPEAETGGGGPPSAPSQETKAEVWGGGWMKVTVNYLF